MIKENFSITVSVAFFKKVHFFLAQTWINSRCFCGNLFITELHIRENGNKMFLLKLFSFLNISITKRVVGDVYNIDLSHPLIAF